MDPDATLGEGGFGLSEWRARSPVHFRSYASAKDRAVLLRRAADESKGEIDGLHDNVQTLQGAIAGHASALNTYKQQIRVKEDECRELSLELKAVRVENDHLKSRLDAAEENVQSLEAARRKTSSAVAAAEQAARDKEARMRDLQVRLEGLDQELCFANQRVCNSDTEIAELRRRLLTAEGAAEKCASRADAATQQLNLLQKQLQDLTHTNAAMERKCVEEQHQRVELVSLLKHAEAAHDEIQSKMEHSEVVIADLRRDATEMTKLKMSLGETKRQLQTVLAAKNGVNIELIRSEEALAAALSDATLAERLRGELQQLANMYDTVSAKLEASEDALNTTRAELDSSRVRCDEVDRRAITAEREASKLHQDMEAVARGAKMLQENEVLRREDDLELESLRVEVQERRRECEELAMGVERLHEKASRERAKRIELEAFRDEMLALEARNNDRQQVAALSEERLVLEQQLSQVVGTLTMLWNELGPLVITPFSAGMSPADGQLSEVAVGASRLLKRAHSTVAALKKLVMTYTGVLGEGVRRTAEAAMNAETTDDTDDFEVAIQLLSLVLEKLVADMGSAKRTIEEQNVLLHSATLSPQMFDRVSLP
eukprot:TRINITY_DN14189_c0_g1_i1.p1 TRINITY_DN14189_c0_g1~~TRINITY_DN14189_c0_g1_i1.p1  ORF type:complete len:603 (+),score=233.94 TRINITY_DN14189_c0_g1_i1:43-1851(+)